MAIGIKQAPFFLMELLEGANVVMPSFLERAFYPKTTGKFQGKEEQPKKMPIRHTGPGPSVSTSHWSEDW